MFHCMPLDVLLQQYVRHTIALLPAVRQFVVNCLGSSIFVTSIKMVHEHTTHVLLLAIMVMSVCNVVQRFWHCVR